MLATIAQMEADLIEKTMKRFDGNKTQAAKSLGISVPKLYQLLKEYGFKEYLMQQAVEKKPEYEYRVDSGNPNYGSWWPVD